MKNGRRQLEPSSTSAAILLLLAVAALVTAGCVENDAPEPTDEVELESLDPEALAAAGGNGNGNGVGHQDDCVLAQAGPGCSETWTVIARLPDGYPLTDVSGSSGSDVYVVGWQTPLRYYLPGQNGRGRVINYDGAQWVDETDGPRATLFAVGVADNGQAAYVAGADGALAYKRPGGGWQNVPSSLTADLSDVFVDQKSNHLAWVVGDNGTFVSLRGNHLTRIPTGTTADLNGIWGTGNVGIVGDAGTFLKYSKHTGVIAIPTGTTADLNGIWGTGNVGIWGTGNVGHPGNGNGNGNGNGGSRGIWGTGNVGIWGTGNVGVIVGDGGTILLDTAAGVVADASPTTADLNGIWGTGNVGVIVGDDGTLLVRTRRTGWTQVTLEVDGQPFTENLTSVWGSSGSDIFVTSDAGTVLHFGLH